MDHTDTLMKDKDYNLISTLYHNLQGMETASIYARDAEQDGDEEVKNFFHEVQDKYKEISDQAKDLLTKRISDEC